MSLTASNSAGLLFVCQTTQSTGNIFGQLFNDINGDGAFDPSGSNPETFPSLRKKRETIVTTGFTAV
jgi:hypothetical protein